MQPPAATTPAIVPVPIGPPVGVAAHVDTLGARSRALLALWRAYLDARPYTGGRRPQWSRAEQRRWPVYDVATFSAYGSAAEYARTRATVLAIEPARPGDTSAYVIRTLFARAQPTDRGSREAPVALTRVYAVREDGRWVLASALPRLTARWRRTVVGPITYVFPPEHRFDAARARRAVGFADSLAAAFGAPRPSSVTYYLAHTPEEAFRLAGVDYTPSGAAGRTVPANGMVFSGLPAYGEYYPHELVHLVLDGPAAARGAPDVLREGLAVWLGGSRGTPWPALRTTLAAAVRADPTLTLDHLVRAPRAWLDLPSDSLGPRAAAALLELVHARGGMPALRAALSAPGAATAPRSGTGGERNAAPDVLWGAARALRLSDAALDAAWHRALTDGPR